MCVLLDFLSNSMASCVVQTILGVCPSVLGEWEPCLLVHYFDVCICTLHSHSLWLCGAQNQWVTRWWLHPSFMLWVVRVRFMVEQSSMWLVQGMSRREETKWEHSIDQWLPKCALVGCKGTAGWHYIVNFTSTKAHNAILLHDIIMIMIISQCRGYTL